jgi:chromosome segregation protein
MRCCCILIVCIPDVRRGIGIVLFGRVGKGVPVYLKSLEMVGFKSFMDKTKLVFDPGLTCIVGPNGCGKSNVSDAVRWVLGEQSAKALRGSKMEDCIFNGTDTRKPLGMAEVSINFADCEKTLGVEFDEVTVTRRVFRDGEGQYFINKTPCRLKDLQRLFMDTGIGTASYSLMEQGRIDRVLSARPEDRRAVFEEASGITKFKSDKKEALRKLESTEANLLRLADVIREVKRQIGSLQRQAGKARRYQELSEELKGFDLFITRERLAALDVTLRDSERHIAEAEAAVDQAHGHIAELEKQTAEARRALAETERRIGGELEAGVRARGNLDHTRELLATNRRRIDEYRLWAERDSREIDQNRGLIEEHRRHADTLAARLAEVRAEHKTASEELKQAADAFDLHRGRIDQTRGQVQRLRDEALELESLTAKLQNQVVEIETRERSNVLDRERLATEKSQLARAAAAFDKRKLDMAREIEAARVVVATAETALTEREAERAAIDADLRKLRQLCADLQAQAAARKAQIDLLSDRETEQDDAPEGNRRLLDASNPLGIDRDALVGALIDRIETPEDCRVAVEAALRSVLDALLVRGQADAVRLADAVQAARAGSVRLVCAMDGPAAEAEPPAAPGARRLAALVQCDETARPVIDRLLGRCWLVERLADVPHPMPPATAWVTPQGAVARAEGIFEFTMPRSSAASALGRRHLLKQNNESLAGLAGQLRTRQADIEHLSSKLAEAEAALRDRRGDLDEARHGAAQKEGELQLVSRETAAARDRLETVTWELEELQSRGADGDEQKRAIASRQEDTRGQRERIAHTIQTQVGELQTLEARHNELQNALTDRRVRFAELSQEIRHVESGNEAAAARVRELERAVEGRQAGMHSYEESIDRLTAEMAESEGRLAELEAAVREAETRLAALRAEKDAQSRELGRIEAALTTERGQLESLQAKRSDIEVRRAEDKMRRQNQIDRVTTEYHVGVNDLMEAREPDWRGERPPTDDLETTIAELRTKIEAMGPVNLVAIDEYKELEERYSFLAAQELDLVTSKEQLMEMIRTIDRTTSELFRTTFELVNANFETMFVRLFNGGSAKLVLVNEEDVLECGIEIIARPPGKRLQNVSLLSGGERTMTAVALLFSIYMIKPSPFCLLDELDAALDESNIGRFVQVLKDFLAQSQFLVITHNRQTIASARTVYGVTMQEKGVSRVVSMRFRERPDPKLIDVPAEPANGEPQAPDEP